MSGKIEIGSTELDDAWRRFVELRANPDLGDASDEDLCRSAAYCSAQASKSAKDYIMFCLLARALAPRVDGEIQPSHVVNAQYQSGTDSNNRRNLIKRIKRAWEHFEKWRATWSSDDPGRLKQKTHLSGSSSSSEPILVFSARAGSWWTIENVGSGPAINITIADGDADGAWVDITRCYPLVVGKRVALTWLRAGWRLAAVYSDADGRLFTTICSNHENRRQSGNSFPAWEARSDERTYRWYEQYVEANPGLEANLRARVDGLPPADAAFLLDVIRNEPLAQLSYQFKRPDLRKYFRENSYTATYEDLESVARLLSEDERATMRFIRAFQMRKGLLLGDVLLPTDDE